MKPSQLVLAAILATGVAAPIEALAEDTAAAATNDSRNSSTAR